MLLKSIKACPKCGSVDIKDNSAPLGSGTIKYECNNCGFEG